MIFLMSVWTRAITPAISSVATPRIATSECTSGAFWNSTWQRTTR